MFDHTIREQYALVRPSATQRSTVVAILSSVTLEAHHLPSLLGLYAEPSRPNFLSAALHDRRTPVRVSFSGASLRSSAITA
jgi:hypothetical protein